LITQATPWDGLDVQAVVDLGTEEGRRAADVELEDLACAWALDRASRRKPASWAIAERLIKAGGLAFS
jgi:hypothetical protein